MLEHFGSGYVTLLVDVAYDEGGKAVRFSAAHYRHSALTHLAHAAGRGTDFGVKHGLYGVYNYNCGFEVFGCGQNLADLSFREHINVTLGDTQPLGAHFDLPAALLTRNIQHALTSAYEPAELQQQRGFANTGCAANQYYAAAHSAAAEYSVQLTNTG